MALAARRQAVEATQRVELASHQRREALLAFEQAAANQAWAEYTRLGRLALEADERERHARSALVDVLRNT